MKYHDGSFARTICWFISTFKNNLFLCYYENREDEMSQETETFPTLNKDLFRLLKWLEAHEVTHIAMERTGI